MSYAPTITPGGLHQKLNVVTRVAIEGKAKQNKEGASIRLYLKINVPLDNVQPGSTIPLFPAYSPEENVKILSSQVHPLNNHSVPYNFSSTVSPLLHNAARALNLPARSTETFNSAFSISSPKSTPAILPGDGREGRSENIAPIDSRYTGHILVSGYHISYVLPKVFPTRPKNLSETESEDHARRQRRMSIGERGSAQFMAAIDMVVPFVSSPPRSPYLLSIPIPRCLHNNIKLRIFPPSAPSSSFASLSSIEDDANSWDLTSDPHVTRSTSSRPSRSNSYTHFADDESSDSSTAGFSDGCGIQGTFPSAERIRIRWAKPIKNIDIPSGTGDDRRRVGVKDVKGEMTCTIRGKATAKDRNGAAGLLVDVVYKATCRGVWFPGVATLLGLDVGLETKGSDAYWADGSLNIWNINGEAGFMGFDSGTSPRQTGLQSRTASLDSTNSNTPPAHASSLPGDANNSSSLTASLLRAPLPAQGVDYSFEGSVTTPGFLSSTSSMSSIRSLTPASSSLLAEPEAPPGLPITLHVNMNEIIAPANNVFTFSIKGSILVVARANSSRSKLTRPSSPENSGDEEAPPDPEPIVLPRFTVLAADHESITTIICNEVNEISANLEVYAAGDHSRDAQTRTVLQRGNSMKCSHGGSRITLRSVIPLNGASAWARSIQTLNGPHTPIAKKSALPRIPSNSFLGRTDPSQQPKRDGPLIIPSVKASVTPLLHENELLPKSYAVRLRLNAPTASESEWLEFGLAQQEADDLSPLLNAKEGKPPRVVIVSATMEGIPVKHETVASVKPEASGLGLPFDQMSGKEWISWVRVHVGPSGDGGSVVVDYVVSERADHGAKGKAKLKNKALLCILLPSFSIPVGRLEVKIEASGVSIVSLKSNFIHQQPTSTGRKLLNFSMEEFFYPSLCITVRPMARTHTTWMKPSSGMIALTTWMLIVFSFVLMHRAHEQQAMRILGHSVPAPLATGDPHCTLEPVAATTTITSTVYSLTSAKWWEDATPTWHAPVPLSPSLTSVITPHPESSPIDQYSAEEPTIHANHATSSVAAPQPTASLMDQYALSLPIQGLFNFTWPTHDFHATVDKVMQTLDKLWYVLRKAYHYPLDPP
ncbi:hypothetical protein H0H87_002840 [Tephrocybe sp. NHM501043]|nr:hypothetical protein H0H87_002840 [Tephrocybe sp. NHM501043]